MLPDFERADRIGEFWGYQESRTIALVMFSPWAKAYQTPDSPFGWTQAEQAKRDLHTAEDWGTTAFARWNVSMFAPGHERDAAFVEAMARYWRACASQSAIRAIDAMHTEIDARPVLGSIHVPTLVMNRSDDGLQTFDEPRFIAKAIFGTKFVELPGKERDLEDRGSRSRRRTRSWLLCDLDDEP